MIAGMGVLFDYFSAASDEEAATVIDLPGGPTATTSAVPAGRVPKRGLFRRRDQTSEPEAPDGSAVTLFDAMPGNGIDPVVQLGTLEGLLTGRPYDEVAADPRSGHDLAVRNGGERVVVTVTDSLTTALANANDEALERVAEPWSQTEEFWGAADPAELTVFLKDLSRVATRAQQGGRQLYCWISV
jgi:hypothetical protein